MDGSTNGQTILSKVPVARLYNASGSFGYNGGNVTTITCSSADTNDTSVFTATSGQNKIVCKKTGYYLIAYALHGRCSTTGRKEVSVIVGSDKEAAYGIQYEEETSGNNTMFATVILYLSANSDVQLGGYFSNSSGTFTIANKSTYLHITYLGS